MTNKTDKEILIEALDKIGCPYSEHQLEEIYGEIASLVDLYEKIEIKFAKDQSVEFFYRFKFDKNGKYIP